MLFVDAFVLSFVLGGWIRVVLRVDLVVDWEVVCVWVNLECFSKSLFDWCTVFVEFTFNIV